MGSDIGSIAFNGYITHVTFYAGATSVILSLGVLVLCSKGIIRDPFEEKLFRWLLLATFCLSVINVFAFTGSDQILPLFLSMLLQTVNDLLQSLEVILWLCYADYRIYRSRDHLVRSYLKRLIPLFIIVILTILNLFTGFLFYIDSTHLWHLTMGQALLEAVRLCYLIAGIIQVAAYKAKHREFKFFAVSGFVLPVLAGYLFTALSSYAVLPLGFAIGLTNVYAGIINETSFMDRDTGYYNCFYMKYLEADIRDGVIPVKSAMTYNLKDAKDMPAFSKCLDPLIPNKCVMIRYDPTTVIMLAEVSDRFALGMMKEDVEESLKTKDIPMQIQTMIKGKNESGPEFYRKLTKKADEDT